MITVEYWMYGNRWVSSVEERYGKEKYGKQSIDWE